jgi:hypothetical protein
MNSEIKAGDFLYEMYGYDATLYNFYQVTRIVSAKTIEVRTITSKCVDIEGNDNRNYVYVVPEPDTFDSEPVRKRLNKYGHWGYTKWDGTPKSESAWGSY